MKNMAQSYVTVNEGSLVGSIIVLTMLTAIVHLLLAFSHGIPIDKFSTLFLLNGIGYFALLGALYLPTFARIQPIVRWVLIAYTTLTVIVWIIVTHADYDPFDYIDKLIEISLIVLLLIEALRTKMSRKV